MSECYIFRMQTDWTLLFHEIIFLSSDQCRLKLRIVGSIKSRIYNNSKNHKFRFSRLTIEKSMITVSNLTNY